VKTSLQQCALHVAECLYRLEVDTTTERDYVMLAERLGMRGDDPRTPRAWLTELVLSGHQAWVGGDSAPLRNIYQNMVDLGMCR
jgi:hypothetical protein